MQSIPSIAEVSPEDAAWRIYTVPATVGGDSSPLLSEEVSMHRGIPRVAHLVVSLWRLAREVKARHDLDMTDPQYSLPARKLLASHNMQLAIRCKFGLEDNRHYATRIPQAPEYVGQCLDSTVSDDVRVAPDGSDGTSALDAPAERPMVIAAALFAPPAQERWVMAVPVEQEAVHMGDDPVSFPGDNAMSVASDAPSAARRANSRELRAKRWKELGLDHLLESLRSSSPEDVPVDNQTYSSTCSALQSALEPAGHVAAGSLRGSEVELTAREEGIISAVNLAAGPSGLLVTARNLGIPIDGIIRTVVRQRLQAEGAGIDPQSALRTDSTIRAAVLKALEEIVGPHVERPAGDGSKASM